MGQLPNAIKIARLRSDEKKLIVRICNEVYGTNKENNTKLGEGLIKITGKEEPGHLWGVFTIFF